MKSIEESQLKTTLKDQNYIEEFNIKDKTPDDISLQESFSQINKSVIRFSVYPNPSTDGIFNINLFTERNVNLSIKNLVGKTILNEFIKPIEGTKHKVSLEDQNKGIYFLTIGNKTTKLLIE